MLIHCSILLDFLCELCYDAQIHEHQVMPTVPLSSLTGHIYYYYYYYYLLLVTDIIIIIKSYLRT